MAGISSQGSHAGRPHVASGWHETATLSVTSRPLMSLLNWTPPRSPGPRVAPWMAVTPAQSGLRQAPTGLDCIPGLIGSDVGISRLISPMGRFLRGRSIRVFYH